MIIKVYYCAGGVSWHSFSWCNFDHRRLLCTVTFFLHTLEQRVITRQSVTGCESKKRE